MKVQNLHKELLGDRVRITTSVTWEDCPRPALEVFFETPAAFSDDFLPSAVALLAGVMIPASHHGEKRITIEGSICPELHRGLQTVLRLFRGWYGPDWQTPVVEPSLGFASTRPRAGPRVGSFLSGGVDSLATIRENRLLYPLDHPALIRDCLIVHGFDLGGEVRLPASRDVFDDALTALASVAKDTGVNLIPVYTNIRHLDDDIHFWSYQFHGSALASVGHCFSGRLTRVLVGSTAEADLVTREPWGSHPMVDPCLASAALDFRHDGWHMDRLEKVRLLADWDVALKSMRVCTNPHFPRGQINCGKCEKCIRTMTQLLIAGKLAQATAFPHRDVTPDMLNSVAFTECWFYKYYARMREPLRQAGRLDLVAVIDAKLAEFDRYLYWKEERGWKGAVRRWDRLHLGGRLTRLLGGQRG